MFEVLEGVLLILAGDKTCKQTYSVSDRDFKANSLTFGMLI